MTDDFRYYLRVRYGECDAQKVVFNARYGDYVDLAATEFFRALGIAAGTEEFDYQAVKLTIEWKAPARFHQALELAVRIKHVGHTSFTMAVEFRIAGDERITATAELVGVLVDRSLSKKPISPAMRELMLRGAPGVRVDHAAYLSQLEPA